MRSYKSRITFYAFFLAIVIIAIVLLLSANLAIPNAPSQYDLGNKYLQITTDKTEYKLGETVNISIENMFNESLFVTYSGCMGEAFGISKYENNKWIEYQPGCGFCQALVVEQTFVPQKTAYFQWAQRVIDVSEGESNCKYSKTEPGWYRIRITTTTPGTVINSYSLPFQITMSINVSLTDTKYCDSANDCVPDKCCHPNYLINKKYAPNCTELTLCTQICFGNLDCWLWEPACENNTCVAQPCTKDMNCSIGKRIR